MNKEAINRIINTIATYISSYEFDGVYENKNVLDLLCNDLREAIHSRDVCCEDEIKCSECKKEDNSDNCGFND